MATENNLMDGNVLDKLKRLLATTLSDTDAAPSVKDDDHIVNDLGLDSLQMIAFLLDVEAQFQVAIDFEKLDIAKLGSVQEFSRYVESLVG
jgi:acyl carrier protein